MTKEKIHVAYAADEKYALPLTVSLFSLLENYSFLMPLEIHVLDGGISEKSKALLLRSLECFLSKNFELIWHKPELSHVKHLRTNLHLSQTVYLRLFLPELLDAAVEKILYLDSDTLVLNDVTPLYQEGMSGFPLCAAQDIMGTFGSPLNCLGAHLERLHILGDAKYFNSGVLLLNLALWRAQNLSQSILDFSADNPELLWLADQNAINVFFYGRIGELDRSWNHQFPLKEIREGTWDFPLLSTEGIAPKIMHFLSGEKPWLPECGIPEKEHFYRYWKKTSWPFEVNAGGGVRGERHGTAVPST